MCWRSFCFISHIHAAVLLMRYFFMSFRVPSRAHMRSLGWHGGGVSGKGLLQSDPASEEGPTTEGLPVARADHGCGHGQCQRGAVNMSRSLAVLLRGLSDSSTVQVRSALLDKPEVSSRRSLWWGPPHQRRRRGTFVPPSFSWLASMSKPAGASVS